VFCICQILQKKWECHETGNHLFIDFKKAHDSFRRKVFYNILLEFGVPIKVVRFIKICLNETYVKVCIPIQNGLQQGDALLPVKPGGTEIKWDITAAGLC
jgi:hypothetical protein